MTGKVTCMAWTSHVDYIKPWSTEWPPKPSGGREGRGVLFAGGGGGYGQLFLLLSQVYSGLVTWHLRRDVVS